MSVARPHQPLTKSRERATEGEVAESSQYNLRKRGSHHNVSSLTNWGELEVSHSSSTGTVTAARSSCGDVIMAASEQLAAAIAGLVDSQRQQAEFQARLLETLANREAGNRVATEDRASKLAPYTDGEDIDAFLATFESMMRLNDVAEDDWVQKLVPLLRGKAREACEGLSYDETYEEVKDTLYRYFNVTEEGNRRKFREYQWSKQTNPECYVARKLKLLERWLTPGEGVDQIVEKVHLEGVMDGLPKDMRAWIGEREPRSARDVARWMQTYLTYHLPHYTTNHRHDSSLGVESGNYHKTKGSSPAGVSRPSHSKSYNTTMKSPTGGRGRKTKLSTNH